MYYCSVKGSRLKFFFPWESLRRGLSEIEFWGRAGGQRGPGKRECTERPCSQTCIQILVLLLHGCVTLDKLLLEPLFPHLQMGLMYTVQELNNVMHGKR